MNTEFSRRGIIFHGKDPLSLSESSGRNPVNFGFNNSDLLNLRNENDFTISAVAHNRTCSRKIKNKVKEIKNLELYLSLHYSYEYLYFQY